MCLYIIYYIMLYYINPVIDSSFFIFVFLSLWKMKTFQIPLIVAFKEGNIGPGWLGSALRAGPSRASHEQGQGPVFLHVPLCLY